MPVEYYFLATVMDFLNQQGGHLSAGHIFCWTFAKVLHIGRQAHLKLNFIPKETILGVSQA